MTFNVINHGSDTLTLGSVELPGGYYVVGGLSPSLVPGASDSFTVAIDTSAAGLQAGEIRIATNDADESIYNFSIEGFVDNGSQKLILGISERNAYEGNTIIANVRRPGTANGEVTVSLVANDDTEVSVPTSVTFLDGEDYATFEIQVLSDATFDTTKLVEITATATGYSPASNMIDIPTLGDANGLSESDFVFRTGNGNANTDFSELPITANVSVRESDARRPWNREGEPIWIWWLKLNHCSGW